MKNQNENVLVRLTEAQCKLVEFLKREHSYANLMEGAAAAQAQIFNLIHIVTADCPDHAEEIVVEEISEFFFFAIQTFRKLKVYDDLKEQL